MSACATACLACAWRLGALQNHHGPMPQRCMYCTFLRHEESGLRHGGMFHGRLIIVSRPSICSRWLHSASREMQSSAGRYLASKWLDQAGLAAASRRPRLKFLRFSGEEAASQLQRTRTRSSARHLCTASAASTNDMSNEVSHKAYPMHTQELAQLLSWLWALYDLCSWLSAGSHGFGFRVPKTCQTQPSAPEERIHQRLRSW